MRIFYFLAIIPLIVAINWFWQNNETTVDNQEYPINFNIYGMTSWNFSTETKTIVRSNKAQYDARSNQVRLARPMIQGYRQKKLFVETYANDGVYYETSNNLLLAGDVSIAIKTNNTHIFTEQLLVNFVDERAATSASVKVIGEDFQLSGTGAEFGLKNQDLELFANVQTSIELQ